MTHDISQGNESSILMLSVCSRNLNVTFGRDISVHMLTDRLTS